MKPFDEQLKREINEHCKDDYILRWEETAYCDCGAEIDKVPPNVKMEDILKNKEVEFECPNCQCMITVRLMVNRVLRYTTLSVLFELWELGCDIFPAIECEYYIESEE